MTIHIKPSHRGRLTALKKRTGKTEAELYRTGSPATRKMITFARNARKWKHSDGGNLFDSPNMFNWGGGTLSGRHMDYGEEWNSRVNKLRALNQFIGETGQQISNTVDSMKGAGDAGSVGDFAKGSKENTSFANFNPNTWDGKTLTDGKTWNWQTQSYQKNPNQMSPNFGGNFAPDFRFQGKQTPTTTLNLNPNSFSTVGKMGNFAEGGKIQLGINYDKYNTPKQKTDVWGFVQNSGLMPDMSQLQQVQGMMNNFQNFGNMGQGTSGMSAVPTGKKACGGKLKKCGGKLYSGGGNLFDYGGDFSNGQTLYNTGGTHEENPYEGVQVGVDNQGTPNLVEEGEVRYQDYIFSNRLSLDEDMAKKYNIPKKYADTTFAYIAEKMGEESKEREYDPISQRGLKANMEKLRGAQEEVKAIKAQEEMMQQVQQIANELGVAPEDVIAAMQMQQEEAAQQEAIAQQQAMQEEVMAQQPSQEEMAAMEIQEMMPQEGMSMQGYALGGTLFDYPNYNPSNPQRYGTLFDAYAETQNVNKFAGGTKNLRNPRTNYVTIITPEEKARQEALQEMWARKSFASSTPQARGTSKNTKKPQERTNRYLSGKISEEELWKKYTKKSLLDIIQRFEDAYNKAQTPEEKIALRKDFIQKFNSVQESYAKMYQEGVDPRIANDIVKAHQTAFDEFGGNYGYTGIEADLNNDGRVIFKDSTKNKFTADGFRQAITDTRHLGTNMYDKDMADFYKEVNERLHKSGINYGLLDKDSMRYNGNELYGLSEAIDRNQEKLPEINIPIEKSPIEKGKQRIEGEISSIAPEQSPTTNSNNPQSQEQSTGEQSKVYNTTPNYSMLDFIPLWQYLTARRPDYSQADALVNYTNRMPKPTYKPIGDYVQYHPFDRQYAAEQQRQRTAATMRNNWNISGGNRGYAGAMNLAANYQGQLADAEMQRQADAANLAQRMQVAQFNRGTNQFNAEAFNRLELQRPYQYQLGLQARAQRAAMHNAIDNAYSAAKSTNLNTFLNNMYNRRREAQDRAQLEWLTDRGVFGTGADTNPFLTQEDSFWNWLRQGNWRKFNKNK